MIQVNGLNGVIWVHGLNLEDRVNVVNEVSGGEWDGLSEFDECDELGKYGELVG